MEIIGAYLLKSFTISGILTTYYWLALRNKKFHQYNRYYLLSAIIASIFIPLLDFRWLNIQSSNGLVGNLLLATYPDTLEGKVFESVTARILLDSMILISSILFITLLLRIAWIYYQKRKHVSVRMNGFNLIQTELKQAPFSFFNNLFWKNGILMDDECGRKILRHELAHIREKYTLDKLFSQFVSCIFWMNPFYWIIQKELNIIHEFIADERSIERGDTTAFAQMLLQSHNEGRYLDPANAFFQSPVKRRLMMIADLKNARYNYLRKMLVIPIAVLLFAMLSCKIDKPQMTPILEQDAFNQKIRDEKAAIVNEYFSKKKMTQGKIIPK